ncbi:MAG: ASCH domain-containing protein [Sulfolobales archaeon]|nr:ASCH domain-containing protein [Sulfolobales archaeon]MCX8199061.1 ASCH domain-containing protein [Sulfolobales archaeon]MDW8170040.1 ASCH domain-containing protein [Desulfurococcaceae archaeon]
MNAARKGVKKYLGRHIMVKGRYIDLILSGRKIATIRLGVIRPKYSEVIIHGGGRPIAKAKIVKVYYKRIKDLTDEEARMDGFLSKEELIDELKGIYGGLSSDELVTIVIFQVLQRFDELPVNEPYLGLEVRDLAGLGLRYLNNELSDEERKILLSLTKTNSIRAASMSLFNSVSKRYLVRRVLKKVLRKLLEGNMLGK